MFSFVKKYAASIEGIEIYPLIGLFIFMLFFVVLIWWLIKADKAFIKHMEYMPLQTDEETKQNQTI